MPSLLHEALLMLFRNRPELAPELLRDALQVPLPDYSEARIESAELTEILPTVPYWDLVVHALGTATRKALEALMRSGTYEYQSDFARKYFFEGVEKGKTEGRAEGEAKGRAFAVIQVLRARGISVEKDVEDRILACTDTTVVDRWIARAVVVTSAEQLFED